MTEDVKDSAWNDLLSWLQSKNPQIKHELFVRSRWIPGAGRGLFTITDVPPNTPLFTIPESAHMNAKTLSPLYGPSITSHLTAIQLISMHLFLHRPDQETDRIRTDPKFGPYISILPKDFEGHPLSWLIKSSCGESHDVDFLIKCSPPATQRALNAMAGRFWKDWNVVSQLLVTISSNSLNDHTTARVVQHANPLVAASKTPPYDSKKYIHMYLWAWLNVNTRCVYHRIRSAKSHPDNLTLCPLLDLANHTSSPTHTSSKAPIPTFFSPSTCTLHKGDEVCLRYGPHSNITLFTEYGFVEKYSPNGDQVDVSDILESLFHGKGFLGEWMKTTLEATNYWGNWTLHDTPRPAHPSYRLLPALRLLQLSPPLSQDTSVDEPTYDSPELKIWHETILGEKDIVSPENEKAVWQQLLGICEVAAKRADGGLDQLQQACLGRKLLGWREYAVEAIRTLWLEEKKVATAVMRSIESGQTMD